MISKLFLTIDDAVKVAVFHFGKERANLEIKVRILEERINEK